MMGYQLWPDKFTQLFEGFPDCCFHFFHGCVTGRKWWWYPWWCTWGWWCTWKLSFNRWRWWWCTSWSNRWWSWCIRMRPTCWRARWSSTRWSRAWGAGSSWKIWWNISIRINFIFMLARFNLLLKFFCLLFKSILLIFLLLNFFFQRFYGNLMCKVGFF